MANSTFKTVCHLLGYVLLLSAFCNTALAETSWTTGAYGNNEDRSRTLSISGATSWWSRTHKNVAVASDGGREVKVTLSDFTDTNNAKVSADLDLYTKLYSGNPDDSDIAASDITTNRYDCRPYHGDNATETCTTVYYKDSNSNIDEKVRIRVRGYYASRSVDKTVRFKLTTKTSRRTAY